MRRKINGSLVAGGLLAASVIAGIGFASLVAPHGWAELRQTLLDGPIQYLVIAPFFLLVGLELKRELVTGALRPIRNVLSPLVAAVLGVALPALWYVFILRGQPALSGWAIPTATDVTFALAVYQVFGSALPRAAKTFLLSFAVLDDLIAVILITVLFGFQGANGFVELLPVLLAFSIPGGWLTRFEGGIARYLSYAGLPVFAFSIAAVRLPGSEVFTSAIFWAIFARVVWKWLGVYLGGRIGSLWATPTMHLSNGTLVAVAALGGVGFTVSLLIAQLALGDSPRDFAAAIGATFAASLCAMAIGGLLIARAAKRYT